jgi:membrane-associated phospholipid phosphatase
VRRSELVIAAYFVYTSVLALIAGINGPGATVAVTLNLTVLAAYGLLIYADARSGLDVVRVVRDWFPPLVVLMAYREMGWFAPLQHTYALERLWVVWDRVVLRNWGVHGAIELLGPLVPSLLEIAYTLVYVVAPFALAMLYVYGAQKRAEKFLLLFVLGALLSYAQFPFWPSEPPRIVFAGEDAPSFDTVFRRFNWFLLGGYSIHTSVFPSAHVSSAYAAAFGMVRALPEKPWVGRFLLVLATLIATATVYGRYHYVVDAIAGFAVGVLALGLGLAMERWSGA